MPPILKNQAEAFKNKELLVQRLIGSVGGFLDLMTIHLGTQLGFYKALAESPALTVGELAEKTGTTPRYVQEWLEQQAVSGLLLVDDETLPASERRFTLPKGYDAVLANPDSLDYMAPLAQVALGVSHPIDELVTVFKTGEGIPYEHYGRHLREGQGAINRPMLLRQLATEWLPRIHQAHQRLLKPRSRVADIGCGLGYSSVGLALGYPNIDVTGFDLDYDSIEAARHIAQEYGVSDRVRFHCADAAQAAGEKPYDLVLAVECIHDMANPVSVLKTMNTLAGEEGVVLVVDERVHPAFTTQKSEDSMDWMMYGWSVLHCLPVGMSAKPSAQTGTVMRPATLEAYAIKAGFGRVEILPIDHPFFRIYRLYQG